MIKNTFLKYLGQFEQTLNQYGYIKNKEEPVESVLYKENISTEYINNQIQSRIDLDYTVWSKDCSASLGMFMYKIPKEQTFFSLSRFLDKHNLNNSIVSKCPAGVDFEPFVKKYFEDLKVLFENELNDQITGKTFENHMDALRKSMDEY
jgi:hypothetical protein